MQTLVFLACILQISFVFSNITKHGRLIPEITVSEKGGLKVSLPDGPGIEGFAFNANVNGPIKLGHIGEISNNARKNHHGKWIVEDLEAGLKPGDDVHWWIVVERYGNKYADGGVFAVQGDEYSDDFDNHEIHA